MLIEEEATEETISQVWEDRNEFDSNFAEELIRLSNKNCVGSVSVTKSGNFLRQINSNIIQYYYYSAFAIL